MMKSLKLFLLLYTVTLQAQLYKGLDLTKEQKKELKNICKKHSKVHDSLFKDYNYKINKLEYNSNEFFAFKSKYKRKKDSIDVLVDQDIAKVLNEKQKKIFWERVAQKNN